MSMEDKFKPQIDKPTPSYREVFTLGKEVIFSRIRNNVFKGKIERIDGNQITISYIHMGVQKRIVVSVHTLRELNPIQMPRSK